MITVHLSDGNTVQVPGTQAESNADGSLLIYATEPEEEEKEKEDRRRDKVRPGSRLRLAAVFASGVWMYAVADET